MGKEKFVWRHRLSTRILALNIGGLIVIMSMIVGTLWLSWQLEGAGAAINDAGSLRMRANLVQIKLDREEGIDQSDVDKAVQEQNRLLDRLLSGDPSRPLFIPNDSDVRKQFLKVADHWRNKMVPAIYSKDIENRSKIYYALLPDFITQTNLLVSMIERANEQKSNLLRFSQGVLALTVCLGALAIAYLLYLWIILPLGRLQNGVHRMASHDFTVRLPIDSRDEFGGLMQGFNAMADELESLYRDLEARVADKTARMERQNHELTTLYDVLVFLNQPAEIETLCSGFLGKVMRHFNAQGGSLRVLDGRSDRLHLVVSEGLPQDQIGAEQCTHVNACHCGHATFQNKIIIQNLNYSNNKLPCSKSGFVSLAAFRIACLDQSLGEFTLLFSKERNLSAAEAQVLSLLGQHLGVALENRRLSARAREMAVAQERNLLAQGLHDSIAQGLNFLKMQVDLLKRARNVGDHAEVEEIVELISGGIDESYQDVRELLLNFRSKLGPGELFEGIREAADRFSRQTGISVSFFVEDAGGAPLPPEQQLQLLFIVQESLSNIRKHANARSVSINVLNSPDFQIEVTDDGSGFDLAEVDARGEGHIGLHIMRERAERIGAQLEFKTSPGMGTKIRLILSKRLRKAA
ncbi:type IV pili methyl-accepting chemotaxis transducer N-terminal domain-containing protein [Crenobacter caeni]|uniref:Sensor protein n=1 Tax=Crenobacter caeni TaxID=2705474 RepID=A0A6B2KV45_9NEIS|nr:type IV pili methyl-accepting chemotaxis transducer N-terminal domain-containing protein [Crenobacter caeni]NDV14017.1 HAMP domain-containing protein [Crenobacter caeni]NDV14116.1 HAMP domain-containing protein [Crenobacter caeni]